MTTSEDSKSRDNPFLLLVTSHWLSLLGLTLIITSVISWLFVLPLHIRHGADNPYIGIVVIFIIPMVFFLGLILVPIGIFLAKRRIKHRIETEIIDRRAARRRLLWFFVIATVVNVFIGTQFTYRGVQHMESVQFCGQSCHAMKPEFTAYQNSPHSRIECVDCHVEPGAKGFFESKIAGARQMMETIFDRVPKPIPSALETGRLVPARETCEHCHWAEKFSGTRLRIISRFAEDEANTQAQTVLLMMVGGSRTKGIHGMHFAPGVEVWFAARDPKRQTIPIVEYRNVKTGTKKVYRSADAKESDNNLKLIQMQCVDCHNRPTHTFHLPNTAVDRAMLSGYLPLTLPYFKKKSVEILRATYTSSEDAAQQIPSALTKYYEQNYPAVYQARKKDIEDAGKMVAQLYGRNVFPELKVTWGTYPNNLGHADFPGCFRCHDEQHTASDGSTITQDCETCHTPLALEEASPQIMETLGLKKRIEAFQKK